MARGLGLIVFAERFLYLIRIEAKEENLTNAETEIKSCMRFHMRHLLSGHLVAIASDSGLFFCRRSSVVSLFVCLRVLVTFL